MAGVSMVDVVFAVLLWKPIELSSMLSCLCPLMSNVVKVHGQVRWFLVKYMYLTKRTRHGGDTVRQACEGELTAFNRHYDRSPGWQ